MIGYSDCTSHAESPATGPAESGLRKGFCRGVDGDVGSSDHVNHHMPDSAEHKKARGIAGFLV